MYKCRRVEYNFLVDVVFNINWPKPIVLKSDGPSSLLLLIQYKCGYIDNIFLIYFFLLFSIMLNLIHEKKIFNFISSSSLFSIFFLDSSYILFLFLLFFDILYLLTIFQDLDASLNPQLIRS
ncbi:hypothetical protein MtrunA17_Chr6g0474341 [Medicago truncatula]|uniref:Transmembrane protein n=1 Tax=Medicago truncatula TaxID=3880 RepID=A0A396HKV3_MEDTR|nr:hypothetical protein MtrunA17_Chr6g0474341 [Medicago truncatula]